MPDLLLEYFSEEIPARMQANAARDLERMASERLATHGLAFARLQAFAGPRRLTLVAEGLPVAQADRREERRGPRVSAPETALAGFLRSTGATRDALVERDGVFYATLDTPGRATPEILAQVALDIALTFPWPKSMRSGGASFRWVRPLKGVLCLFDGAVVSVEIGGVASGRETRGHRFMGAQGAAFAVVDFADYRAKLEAQFVVVDASERAARIVDGARRVCLDRGLELVEDAGLVDEVAGLVEWPTPVLGDMDPGFLDLPPEVIRTSMRTHQRYFAVRRPGEAALAPHFVVVANVEASDGGAGLAVGNARVLSARLNDARFFWDKDREPEALGRWADTLAGVTFHARLGSMAARVERIARLASVIAPRVGADPRLATLAAGLCKRDLASLMVCEFPDLQGVMGGYYVRRDPYRAAAAATPLHALGPDGSEDPFSAPEDLAREGSRPGAQARWWGGLTRMEVDRIADAVRDHYRPVGPNDSVATEPVTVALALADKLDTLVGFFAIDEKTTGSRDPFALRRAALGVIRLILDSGARLGLSALLTQHFDTLAQSAPDAVDAGAGAATVAEIVGFFADRLTVVLRDRGERHDLVAAVFALGDDDLTRIVARVAALSALLATDDGVNLLSGYRRAANILRAETKKRPDERYDGDPDPALLREPAEISLAIHVEAARVDLAVALEHERFGEAMAALARLRPAVDAFFDDVLVNDPAPTVRLNRLKLLSRLTGAANRVADFSRISG